LALGKTFLFPSGPTTSLSARAQPSSAAPAACHLTRRLGSLPSGAHLSGHHLTPFSYLYFPPFPVTSLASRRRCGKAGRALAPAIAECVHASRSTHRRPLYLPPPISGRRGLRPNPSRAGDSSPKSSTAPPLTSRVKGRRTRTGLAIRGKECRTLRGKENDLEGESPGVLLCFLVASASFTLHGVEPLFADVFTVEAPSAVGEPLNLHLSCGARSSSRGRTSSLERSPPCPCTPPHRRAYAGDADH
jgi:hypothetical protein